MNAVTIFEKQLLPLAPRFADVLPANVSPDRLIRTVVMSVERSPKLLDCDRQSLFNSAMSAAVLGLEVDGVTGQAYLIPFKGKAQLVVGYKGYNTIAARSGITITGSVVREGDEFEYELGSDAFVKHKPALNNKGRIIAAWAAAVAHGRPPVVHVMGIDDLMAVKAKSPGARMSDSPWNDPTIGFPAMCEKTAKRRLARSLPLNMMQVAARMDEAVDEQGKTAWIRDDQNVIVDGEIVEPSQTPTAAALIGDRSAANRGQAAVENPAPPQHLPTAEAPNNATDERTAETGAGTDSEWQLYVERWDSILDDATDSRALGMLWNSSAQKQERLKYTWPAGEFEKLMKRVGARIGELKGAVPA